MAEGTTRPRAETRRRPPPRPRSGTPRSGGELIFGVESAVSTLEPGAAAQPTDKVITLGIYDPLTTYVDGEVEPFLAESLEGNEDLTQYTMTLRAGHHLPRRHTAQRRRRREALRATAGPRRRLPVQGQRRRHRDHGDAGRPRGPDRGLQPQHPQRRLPRPPGRLQRLRRVAHRRRRRDELQDRRRRHRSVHPDRVLRRRARGAREEPRLLGHRRGRHPAPLPRQADRHPDPRLGPARQRPRDRRHRHVPDGRLQDDQAVGGRRLRGPEDQRLQLHRPADEQRQAALRRRQGPPGGRLRHRQGRHQRAGLRRRAGAELLRLRHRLAVLQP